MKKTVIAAMALGLALSASAQANAGTKAYGSTFGKSSYAQERFGKSPFRPGPLKGRDKYHWGNGRPDKGHEHGSSHNDHDKSRGC
ncbi:hypothetical protein [Novosphingobium sp. ST904]|uniref:hypothetical protein n=1 Tax=Novosphingobium sp. ST904 TaxID=1684385 RepID=UPI00104D18DE|nr:hypothetical protein [Novosphingobium sp. ST904]TCM42347.1 hypothetical protein EDF59_102311 [Novosphingobium sp. ST904]